MSLAQSIQRTLNHDEATLLTVGDRLGDLAVNLVLALLIFLVTLWLAGRASSLAKRTIRALPHMQDDITLQSFAGSVARSLVVIIGLIAVLRRLGVETTSIIAVLGAASLAIGLALQGALSNVAAGVMILIFRPYRVGDTVTIAGRTGVVKNLDLFNTELIDADGLKVVCPNGKAFSDVIVNSTDIARRRVELNFVLDYGEDLERAAELALACARKDRRILKHPAPWARPTEVSGVNVTLTVRAWTDPQAHYDVRIDLLGQIKQEFDANQLRLHHPPEPAKPKA